MCRGELQARALERIGSEAIATSAKQVTQGGPEQLTSSGVWYEFLAAMSA